MFSSMSKVSGGDGGSFNGEEEGQGGHPFAPAPPSASASMSRGGSAAQRKPPAAPGKKKRNLPGTPDPTAEVIALSPATLMATNRFVCEVCSKGFQRDQNLQLHRRGHNLPWKLRRQTSSDGEVSEAPARKRVYVCPEAACVHHHPSRALGDLTGIKKHFCRKHGEKKWRCEKCSKRYAVLSDWKAHLKTCGSHQYKCDCGTLFSRRDSFITHRAFCDALAAENGKASQGFPADVAGGGLPEMMAGVMPEDFGCIASNMKSTCTHDLPREQLTSSVMMLPLSPNMTGGGGHLSATALLHKVAQMGSTAIGSVDSVMTTMQHGFLSFADQFISDAPEPTHKGPGVINTGALWSNSVPGVLLGCASKGGSPLSTVDFLGVGRPPRPVTITSHFAAGAAAAGGGREEVHGVEPAATQADAWKSSISSPASSIFSGWQYCRGASH